MLSTPVGPIFRRPTALATDLLFIGRICGCIEPVDVRHFVEGRTNQNTRWRGDAGLGLMEAMVGILVALIIGSVVVHLVRMGFAMYTLNSTTNGIAQQLEMARARALTNKASASVIFLAKDKKYGLDRNGNGRLDNAEADVLPAGVEIDEDTMVTFSK